MGNTPLKVKLQQRQDNERNNLDYDGRNYQSYQRLAAQLHSEFFEVNGYVFKHETGTRPATKRFNDVYLTLPFQKKVLREDWVAMVLRNMPAPSDVLKEFTIRLAYLQQQVEKTIAEVEEYKATLPKAKRTKAKKDTE